MGARVRVDQRTDRLFLDLHVKGRRKRIFTELPATPKNTEILKAKDTKNLLSVVAPIDGTAVLRHAVRGEAVQATVQLFAVADTSRMWLWVDVYESTRIIPIKSPT